MAALEDRLDSVSDQHVETCSRIRVAESAYNQLMALLTNEQSLTASGASSLPEGMTAEEVDHLIDADIEEIDRLRNRVKELESDLVANKNENEHLTERVTRGQQRESRQSKRILELESHLEIARNVNQMNSNADETLIAKVKGREMTITMLRAAIKAALAEIDGRPPESCSKVLNEHTIRNIHAILTNI